VGSLQHMVGHIEEVSQPEDLPFGNIWLWWLNAMLDNERDVGSSLHTWTEELGPRGGSYWAVEQVCSQGKWACEVVLPAGWEFSYSDRYSW